MGFEGGSISCRFFHLPRGLPPDALKRFAADAAPPVDSLGRDAVTGWVTGRHLLDRHITEDSAHLAGYLRLTLLKAERRIPTALLRAHCQMEELSEMQSSGSGGLRRSARSEIRKAVVDRLLPTMPPTLTGIPMVYDDQNRTLYAGAVSEKQLDAFVIALRAVAGDVSVPVVPENLAMELRQINYRDLGATSFSPDGDSLASEGLGRDFLTWLWFFAEEGGGLLEIERLGEISLLVEGPLLFVREGEGAHEAILRKGSPLMSSEAKTALLSGKKLRQARVTFARGDAQWVVTLDADAFVLRGLKLPKEERVDFVSRFQERMLSLDAFRRILIGFFARFLDERGDRKRWGAACRQIQQWVSERRTRA